MTTMTRCTHVLCDRKDAVQCGDCPDEFVYCPVHAEHPNHHVFEVAA
jgi:hypothetical protein